MLPIPQRGRGIIDKEESEGGRGVSEELETLF